MAFVTSVALATPSPFDTRERSLPDARTLATMMVSLTGWILPVYFVAWAFGHYEASAALAAARQRRHRKARVAGETGSYYLIHCRGAQRGQPVRVSSETFVLGSDEGCQLVETGLMPRHCVLLSGAPEVKVRDLNSGQPTWVDGEVLPPARERPIAIGGRLAVGPLELCCSIAIRRWPRKSWSCGRSIAWKTIPISCSTSRPTSSARTAPQPR